MRPLPPIAAALAIAGLLGLSGCAQAPEYASSTAATLQRQVAAVTTDAAGQQYQQALDKLDDLQAAAARAEAAGKLTPKRQAAIDTAISRVRRDLQAAVTAAQQAALDAKLNSLSEQQKSLLTQQQQLAQQQQQQQQQAQQQQSAPQPTQNSDKGSSKESKAPPKDPKASPPASNDGGPGNNGSGPDDNSGKGPGGKGH